MPQGDKTPTPSKGGKNAPSTKAKGDAVDFWKQHSISPNKASPGDRDHWYSNNYIGTDEAQRRNEYAKTKKIISDEKQAIPVRKRLFE